MGSLDTPAAAQHSTLGIDMTILRVPREVSVSARYKQRRVTHLGYGLQVSALLTKHEYTRGGGRPNALHG